MLKLSLIPASANRSTHAGLTALANTTAVKKPCATAALFLVCAALAACATANAGRLARDAETRQDYDLAVVQYTRALHQHPDDVNARAGLERAKLRASQDHLAKGRRLTATGKLDQALVEYEVATELNPANPDIDNALRQTRADLRNKVATEREGKSALETIVERARQTPPPGLDLPPDGKMPASLMFSGANSRQVFLAIGNFGNVSLGFDQTFRDVPVTIDLRNASLADALNAVAQQTHSFYRVTGRSVLVIPDTPAKRREYDEEVVQTFPLSNADLKETMDL
ncbi:MAG TPA: hypothetical protein VHZ73_08510, partial [Vicinamibacterales bacterium]|nr:hypothetical protein [Vicinamibacterales bacterium]